MRITANPYREYVKRPSMMPVPARAGSNPPKGYIIPQKSRDPVSKRTRLPQRGKGDVVVGITGKAVNPKKTKPKLRLPKFKFKKKKR